MPERVIGIIGVDTLTDIGAEPLSDEQLETLLAKYRIDFEGAYHNLMIGTAERTENPAIKERLLNTKPKNSREVFVGILENYFDFDYAAALQKLDIPIVCINGDTTPTRLDYARKYIDVFEVNYIHTGGHLARIIHEF